MSVSFSQAVVLAQPGAQYTFSSLLSVTEGNLPQYLVLVGLDRERYTAASNGDRGTLAGNGNTIGFRQPGESDCYSFGVVFTHTDHGYYNETFGYLSDLQLKTSTDNYRNEYLTLYGFGKTGTPDSDLLAKLNAEVANPWFDGGAFMHTATQAATPANLAYSTSNFIGTLDVVTRSDYVDATPNQATPNEIVAVASTFVGHAWNDNGCWILASNIAAAAGASLPLTSDEARPDLTPPVDNGEWIVAYDSATATEAQQKNWEQQLRPGDVVVSYNSCGGHIMTVVGGSGYASKFIDNSGNAAGDGSPHDIAIWDAHTLVSWAVGPDPKNVVIYRLDTPVITVSKPLCLTPNASGALSSLFSTNDPAGKSVAGYQFYDENPAGGSFTVNGVAQSAHSAASAVTVDASALADTVFAAGSATGSGTIRVRAWNGNYWGDWQSIPVAIGSSVQPASVHAVSDSVQIHGGKSIPLSSLFTATATDSPITSYTITAPPSGGYIDLGGASNLLGTEQGIPGQRTYEVSAADFAKLKFVASSYMEGDTITVTARNGAALDSIPAVVTMDTIGSTALGISRWVGVGEELPLSSLFTVNQSDDTPIISYTFCTDVPVIRWGDVGPSSGGWIDFHGAKDLLADAGVPKGFYGVAAADLDKVTFHAASDTGAQVLEVWAYDGAGSVPGTMTLTTTADTPSVTALPASVHGGDSIALSSLFTLKPEAAAPHYYRIVDPTGGGTVELSRDGTNLATVNDPTPGLIVIHAEDLDKLSYTGGNANATESVAISTSSDMLHWSVEVLLPVSTFGVRETHRLAGSTGNDVFTGTPANDVFSGGAGLDTVVESGPRSNFTVAKTATGCTLADTSGAQGTDTLTDVERVRFDDISLAFDTDSNAGQLYRLYQAAFNRKPDLAGLGWWLHQMDNGLGLQQAASGFVHSAEFVQLYGANLPDTDFVTDLYQNVLHRAPDAAGYGFWLQALAGGHSREEVLTGFSESAENRAQVIGSIQNGIEYIYVG